MKWQVYHRKCSFCGKEDECRHDMIGGIAFYGWGSLEVKGDHEDKDICPECMNRLNMPPIEPKSETNKKEWLVVFPKSPDCCNGSDQYWNHELMELVSDFEFASLFTEEDAKKALTLVIENEVGKHMNGIESPCVQRVSEIHDRKSL